MLLVMSVVQNAAVPRKFLRSVLRGAAAAAASLEDRLNAANVAKLRGTIDACFQSQLSHATTAWTLTLTRMTICTHLTPIIRW
jgi:hypothetical protein